MNLKLLGTFFLSTKKRKAVKVPEAMHSITAHPTTHPSVPTEELWAKNVLY